MLLQIKETLDETIIRLLGPHPRIAAGVLHKKILTEGKKCTLRAVYKELAKLEAQGVVVKVEDKYSLRLTWVVHLLSYADLLYDTHLDPQHLSSLIFEAKQKVTWKFSSLRKLDMGVTQIILALHKLCPKKALCLWCPHQWFEVAHPEKQQQFLKANEISGIKRYHIIGGDTFLDRLCLQYLPKNSVYSFAESPFAEERSRQYTIIGDYLYTAKLDEQSVRRIEALFSKVKSARDIKQEEVDQIFGGKAKCSVALEHNPKKALALKKKFATFFGVSLETLG